MDWLNILEPQGCSQLFKIRVKAGTELAMKNLIFLMLVSPNYLQPVLRRRPLDLNILQL